MPPKMKSSRSHRCEPGKTCTACTNPRVVLRPLGEPMAQTCYRFTTTPPVSSLYKKAEFSDIKLKIGDDMFYAHRLILCASSEVFSKMLGSNWSESKKEILQLEEDDDCVKVFDRFLKYMYSGSTIINESCVIPLFMLADKYDVQALYNECVKVIENGLKVYTAPVNAPVSKIHCHPMYVLSPNMETSSGSETSDSECNAEFDNAVAVEIQEADISLRSSSPTKAGPSSMSSGKVHLVASETFPLGMVVKILSFCTNERVINAALYNLETRLTNQICQENYVVWNDIDQDLIVKMLQDDHFSCDDFILFKATKAWIEYDELRQSDATKNNVLSHIRYPIMHAKDLYTVEKDDLIKNCKAVSDLVHEALRYKLFSQFSTEGDNEKWEGIQYRPRGIKHH